MKNTISNERVDYWISHVIGQYVIQGRFPKDQTESIFRSVKALVDEKNIVGRTGLERIEAIDIINNFCSDMEDRILLKNASPMLIEKYQFQTISIIRKYITEDHEHYHNTEMIVEEIQAKLKEKLIDKSLEKYKAASSFRTFYFRVTNNLVIDELRKLNRRLKTKSLDRVSDVSLIGNDHSLLQYHSELYGSILMVVFQNAERNRFEFCVKTIYRILQNEADIKKAYPKVEAFLIEQILDAFGNDYQFMKKGELWEKLTYLVSKLEDKKRSVRTLQDWVEKQKIKVMELVFKRTLSLKTNHQKQAFDEYLELILYRHYIGLKKNTDYSRNLN